MNLPQLFNFTNVQSCYQVIYIILLDKLYAVGGCDGSASLDSVEVFDPVLGEWRLGPNMNISRSYVGVAVLENRLYAAGGFSGKCHQTLGLQQ